MYIGELSENELAFLETSLNNNKGPSASEFSKLQVRHPYAQERNDNIHLIECKMTHYGQQDLELNSFLLSKFGNDKFQLDFFYKLDYFPGNYTVAHRDKYFVLQTTLILLSEDFTGGELLVDGINVNLDKRGKYINFEGSKQEHSVTEVTFGVRSVLVVMFNKRDSLL